MSGRERGHSGYFLLDFATREFDVTREPPSGTGGTPGHSLLAWLAPRLRSAGYEVDEPDTEDWGWYVDVTDFAGDRYMLGASASRDEGDLFDWTLRVQRQRSFLQWIRGKEVLKRADAILIFLEETMNRPEFNDLNVHEVEFMSFFESLMSWARER